MVTIRWSDHHKWKFRYLHLFKHFGTCNNSNISMIMFLKYKPGVVTLTFHLMEIFSPKNLQYNIITRKTIYNMLFILFDCLCFQYVLFLWTFFIFFNQGYSYLHSLWSCCILPTSWCIFDTSILVFSFASK